MLQRSLCAADGQLLLKARPIPPGDARRIATHVQGFMAEARALPYLGAEIDHRERFNEETLPTGLKLDDCHGCVWLRDAEEKSVEELVRTYQGGHGCVKRRPIYDAVRSLLPWAKQHGTTKAAKKRTVVSDDDADKLARKIARSKRSFRSASQREWATRLKIAVGRVGKLPFWKELHPESKMNAKPKAVAMNRGIESSLGEDDPELTRLMKEQTDDDEGSPLDSTPRRKRSRRPSV